MTGWIIGALVAAAAAQGYGPTSTEIQERTSTPGSEVEKSSHHLSKEEAEARLKNCGARKFQATATARIDGKPRRTKLLLSVPLIM